MASRVKRPSRSSAPSKSDNSMCLSRGLLGADGTKPDPGAVTLL
eukprot:CAMPEP_0175611986 /NCGR_PEP_ID=MMETSP0096-20121207/63593_1 /TAXON_ID=311494 /ORGANISM="Alexandrium monilatum, Strain CCMP3105" /LENGTH=43 /DNA_ID= /DNA_START= /DNA_END= /DNA_ORIENTATION=